MTREETVEFFAARQVLWSRRDAAGLAALHTEDGIVVSPLLATVHGRPAIEQSYNALFGPFPDMDVVGADLLIDGDRVAQVFSATATHVNDFYGLPGTGRRFTIHGVAICTLEGHLIAHEQRIYDYTALLLQIGVLKVKPGH